ncbi:uncharacterized protein LOC129706245 [Leucoraja erinacea]|uniref:uncharacterized protein LOC129706245 n=1 Tax=Leucoraja erinaceus TaxID=7782 RepID=UPI002456545D|nr:uncharacterized protein LOC129706245 [Leucoraja erinacea]
METRTGVCLPGARVWDVSECVQDIMKWDGEEPEVVVHIAPEKEGDPHKAEQQPNVQRNLRKISSGPLRRFQAFDECRITGDESHHVTPISFSCAIVHNVSRTISFRCEGFVGRYLIVSIPGKNKALSICELEVYASMVPELHYIEQHTPRHRSQEPGVPGMASKFAIPTGTGEPLEDDMASTINYMASHLLQDLTMEETAKKYETPANSLLFGWFGSRTKPGFAIRAQLAYSNVHSLQNSEAKISTDDYGVNLALSGWATQSSTRKSAEAYLAIDGRASTLKKLKSCTETNPTNDPWWMIDLHGIYQVSVVRITNRRDCCSEQLQGAEIRIGNSSKGGGMSNELAVVPRIQRPSTTFQPVTESQSPVTYGVMPVSFSCGTIQVMVPQRFTFVCEDFTGRFVSVIIPGKNKTLTLCEVEVYGEKLASLNSEGMFMYTSHAFSQGHSVGSVFGVLCSVLFTYYRKGDFKQTNSRED